MDVPEHRQLEDHIRPPGALAQPHPSSSSPHQQLPSRNNPSDYNPCDYNLNDVPSFMELVERTRPKPLLPPISTLLSCGVPRAFVAREDDNAAECPIRIGRKRLHEDGYHLFPTVTERPTAGSAIEVATNDSIEISAKRQHLHYSSSTSTTLDDPVFSDDLARESSGAGTDCYITPKYLCPPEFDLTQQSTLSPPIVEDPDFKPHLGEYSLHQYVGYPYGPLAAPFQKDLPAVPGGIRFCSELEADPTVSQYIGYPEAPLAPLAPPNKNNQNVLYYTHVPVEPAQHAQSVNQPDLQIDHDGQYFAPHLSLTGRRIIEEPLGHSEGTPLDEVRQSRDNSLLSRRRNSSLMLSSISSPGSTISKVSGPSGLETSIYDLNGDPDDSYSSHPRVLLSPSPDNSFSDQEDDYLL